MLSTVFPRIVRARSINFTAVMLRGQFEGALYSRARFNTRICARKLIVLSLNWIDKFYYGSSLLCSGFIRVCKHSTVQFSVSLA